MRSTKKTKSPFPEKRERAYSQPFSQDVMEIQIEEVLDGEDAAPLAVLQPKTRFTPLFVLIAALILLGVGYGIWRTQYREPSQEEVQQKEVAALIEEVGKLIELPKDEEPTIATVSDPSRLAGQEFFRNAEVGDKVLIYAKARKALLYSPSKHKLIEVAPLNLQGEESRQ